MGHAQTWAGLEARAQRLLLFSLEALQQDFDSDLPFLSLSLALRSRLNQRKALDFLTRHINAEQKLIEWY